MEKNNTYTTDQSKQNCSTMKRSLAFFGGEWAHAVITGKLSESFDYIERSSALDQIPNPDEQYDALVWLAYSSDHPETWKSSGLQELLDDKDNFPYMFNLMRLAKKLIDQGCNLNKYLYRSTKVKDEPYHPSKYWIHLYESSYNCMYDDFIKKHRERQMKEQEKKKQKSILNSIFGPVRKKKTAVE